MAQDIKVGDFVTIIDEFGKEVPGVVVAENAYDVKGRYAIKIDGNYGIYSRSADEITKKEK